MPMVVIEGKTDSPTMCVTAGVHPTEYAGVEAALRIAHTLDHENLRGRIVILPFTNLLGFNARNIGSCPEDLIDIFRAFPGNLGSTISYSIASQVFEKVVRSSNYVIDLHGGEMNESESIPLAWYCRTSDRSVDEASARLAKAFGADYILDATEIRIDGESWHGPAGTLLNEASRAGIPAIIGEAGGGGKMGEDSTRRLYEGVMRICKEIGLVRGSVPTRTCGTLSQLTLLTARHDGLLHSFVGPGQLVHRGQLLAEVLDWKGATRQRITATFAGIITIKVNWLPVRTGEWLVALAKVGNQA